MILAGNRDGTRYAINEMNYLKSMLGTLILIGGSTLGLILVIVIVIMILR
jgi:hypothetical protein